MRQTCSTLGRIRIPRERFGQYLRTGSWSHPDDNIEVKFNPWHDLVTGRFTFKGGGSTSRPWGGGGFTGGGGGSFGGGGATGSWETEKAGSNGKPTATPRASTIIQAARSTVPSGQDPSQWHSIERNGYTYQLDGANRTRQVTGTLTLNPNQARSRTAQANAGGSDRLSTDEGGHYVARRFNGPTDAFNHFAQDSSFNRGDYKSLENQWAKDIGSGKKVYVKIVPSYDGSSKRPLSINVFYTVNGSPKYQIFPNASKGKTRGK